MTSNFYVSYLVSFAIVMTGMILLTLVCYFLRSLGRPGGTVIATAAAGAGRRTDAGGSDEELDEELVAVLAAAAREALQAPVKIHHVHVHREPGIESWSRAGRMDVMISHRVERRR